MKVVAVLCLLAATALQVYAYPSGAPSIACPAIQPMGPHIGSSPPNSANMPDVPYQLDLSQFRCPSGVAGYCYVPEATYERKFIFKNCKVQVCHCYAVCINLALIDSAQQKPNCCLANNLVTVIASLSFPC